MDTFDINDIEIFAAGEWNGDRYSVEDLDKIVHAFQETKESIKPYLKLGHSEGQKLLAEDELPAAGWISNLKRQGDKLVADFTKIPKQIYELLKTGGYRRVSSELFVKPRIGGKMYELVLKAVALLGGATPAVQSLKDIMKLYGIKAEGIATFEDDVTTKSYEFDVDITSTREHVIEKRGEQWCLISKSTGETLGCHASQEDALKQERAIKSSHKSYKGETKTMSEKDDKKIAVYTEQEMQEMRDSVKKFTEESQGLKDKVAELEKRNVSLVAEVKSFKDKARSIEISSKIDAMIQGKKIVPAQKEVAFAILSNLPESSEKHFKVGEKEYKSMEDLVMALLDGNSNSHISTETQTFTGKKFRSAEGTKDSDGEVIHGTDEDKKIREYAQANKKSYKEALMEMSARGELNSL